MKSNLLFYIRSLPTIIVGLFDRLINRKPKIFILCYHSIDNDGWRYSTRLSDFKKEMEYLTRVADPISINDIRLYLKGKKRINNPSFVITFDDGYKNILKAAKVVKKYGIKPTVFLIGDTKNYNKEVLDTRRAFLTKLDCTKLKKQGWKFGSHTMTHPFLTSSKNKENEIRSSKHIISKMTSMDVYAVSYPKGDYDDEVINIAKKEKYEIGLTMDIGYIGKGVDSFRLPRIGVDGSHSFEEFKYLFSPSVVFLKRFLQKYVHI